MSSDVLVTKVLIIGDSGVGKSSLMLRFTKNTFDPEISSTIGIDFQVKPVDVVDPIDGSMKIMNVRLWDTAGQERFRTLTSSFYRGANAVVLVYDVNEPGTFESLEKWTNEAKGFLGTDDEVVFLLIGNKTDMAENKDSMRVSVQCAQDYAKQHKMMFALCSAKTKEGVVHAFEEVARKVYDKISRHKDNERRHQSGIKLSGKGIHDSEIRGACGC
eukprot:Tbor_TRINITY_DN3456_c0_g1::TRINITY_DN3456_c0_g1_i1::g.3696::m.3696/K07910/RAB18; Ras-related protein Rab-18